MWNVYLVVVLNWSDPLTWTPSVGLSWLCTCLPCGLLKFDLGFDANHLSATSRGGLASSLLQFTDTYLQDDEKTRRLEEGRKQYCECESG